MCNISSKTLTKLFNIISRLHHCMRTLNARWEINTKSAREGFFEFETLASGFFEFWNLEFWNLELFEFGILESGIWNFGI